MIGEDATSRDCPFKGDEFVAKVRENPDFNQYWYSSDTIRTLVDFLQTSEISSCAFLSTPSLYFSLDDAEFQSRCALFDCDMALRRNEHCQFYDFRSPLDIDPRFKGHFDCVAIDPPFISEDVWRLYAQSASFLLNPDKGKVVLTTTAENKDLIFELFSARRVRYQPCIPNLVYQYDLYTNFEAPKLDHVNPEIER